MRVETALPLVPGAELTPHAHHPTGRCRDCRYWTAESAQLGRCGWLQDLFDGDWSCVIFKEVPHASVS